MPRSAPSRWRRIARHLSRSRARVAGLVMLVSITLYVLLTVLADTGPWVTDALQQFFLVVASVSAGAVVLPELSSNLWRIRAEEVRELIPDEQIRGLERALVHSQVDDPAWAETVLASALRPLIEAGRQPHRVVANLTYNVQVRPDRQVTLDGAPVPVHRIETMIRAQRVLPPREDDEGIYWVSVARSADALRLEYDQPACLYREVVVEPADWPPGRWDALMRAYSRAEIVLDGTVVEATTDPPAGYEHLETPGLIRWYFDSADLGRFTREHERSSITIKLDYVTSTAENRFHVALRAFYVTGASHVSVKLDDPDDRYVLDREVFLGQALGRPAALGSAPDSAGRKEVSIDTGGDALIWPGSGLLVTWHRREDGVAQAPDGGAAGP